MKAVSTLIIDREHIDEIGEHIETTAWPSRFSNDPKVIIILIAIDVIKFCAVICNLELQICKKTNPRNFDVRSFDSNVILVDRIQHDVSLEALIDHAML